MDKASMGMKNQTTLVGTGPVHVTLKSSHRSESFLAAKAKRELCIDKSEQSLRSTPDSSGS